MKVSFLITDFLKQNESLICLESIKKFAQIDKEVVFLSNGGMVNYAIDAYENGLIDKLIINRRNTGGGNAICEVFGVCQTEYAFLVQNDQELISPVTLQLIDTFLFLLNNGGYDCVDCAGAQAGIGNYSDRAQFVNVDFYNSIYKGKRGECGGPGPFNDNRYTESFVQEFFRECKLKIAHVPPLFKDNGKTSIREIGDGLYSHRCDTKILQVLRKPTYKTPVYPPFNDEEWEEVLLGKWPEEGKVPKEWESHIFKYWD